MNTPEIKKVDDEITQITLKLEDKSILILTIIDVGNGCSIYLDSPGKNLLTNLLGRNHIFARIKGA